MNVEIPTLKKKEYKTRYDKYPEDKRIDVVYTYLFEGKSHRWMDEYILGLRGKQAKGYEAMSILHYLGIWGEYKGLFVNYVLEDAIQILMKQEDDGFRPIIEILGRKLNEDKEYSEIHNIDRVSEQYQMETFSELMQKLDEATMESRKLEKEERIRRLKNASKTPERVDATTVVYRRNPDVVAEVLERADGICERCGRYAPFIRKLDNTPYLEVHHKIRLADGGNDTVENALALSPNCHRELHYGL